jgi:hypothetical protein
MGAKIIKMLHTTNTFSKKSCLETTYNYSAPQTLNMIERLSAEFILLCVAVV